MKYCEELAVKTSQICNDWRWVAKAGEGKLYGLPLRHQDFALIGRASERSKKEIVAPNTLAVIRNSPRRDAHAAVP